MARAGEPAGGAYSKQVELAAREFHEECLELGAGQHLTYTYSAARALQFNINYHAGGKVHYAARKNARHARSKFTPRQAQGYCLMWTNPHKTGIRLTYSLSATGAAAAAK